MIVPISFGYLISPPWQDGTAGEGLKRESKMKKENLEIILEEMNSKLDLLIEGYQLLNGKIDGLSRKTDERFDLVDFKIDTLNKKIDAVAVDLKEHRADTEAHHGGWRVKEIRCE